MQIQRPLPSHVCHRRRNLLLAGSLGGAMLAVPGLAAAGKLLGVASEVYVNGKRAHRGASIGPGDVVRTGGLSEAVFLVGKDAYMLRENSEVRLLEAKQDAGVGASGLRVVRGGLLAMFVPGEKKLLTSSVMAGIGGTGLYVEVDAVKTYLCTCFGEIELANSAGVAQRRVSAQHHNAHILRDGAKGEDFLEPAQQRNHHDEELRLLAALSGRKLPFAQG